ncbi:MAG: cell division protein FtsA [Bacteroidia bacterium]|nr:cell division protein FtsA [Bacteroidia bacterium]
MSKIVCGLDIGSTKICAIVGRLNDLGGIDVLGIGHAPSDGVKRGIVENIDKTIEAIKQAVRAAEQHSNVEIKLVHVGIAGEHIRSKQHKGIITLNNPDAEITAFDVARLHEDMHKISIPAGNKIIHVIPIEYCVDNQYSIREPIGMSGVRLEGNFHIITGQTTAIKNIFRCVKKAGLEVEDLILEPIASSHAVLTEDEKEAGVCLVDIGGGTTDIAIFEDHAIRHTAIIPFGGNIITEDIKAGLSIMKRQAEKLKIDSGCALESAITRDEIIIVPALGDKEPTEIRKSILARIIQARLSEIFYAVHREIEIAGYKRTKLPGGIVVTGGGSQMAHLRQLVEYITGIDCRTGYVQEHISRGFTSEVRNPMYSTGMGLVIYGLKHNPIISETNIESLNQDSISGGQDNLLLSTLSRQKQKVTAAEEVAEQNQPENKKAGFFGKIRGFLEDTVSGANQLLD